MRKFKCRGCAGCCVSKFPKYILDAESPGYRVLPAVDEAGFDKANQESAVAHGFILAKEDIKRIESLGLARSLRVARTIIGPKTKKAKVSVCITRTPFKKKGNWVWACCFLSDRLKCDIYSKRPMVCAAYPFILKDPDGGSHICFDDRQGRWEEYKLSAKDARLRDKYLKAGLYFRMPMAQEEMMSMFRQDPAGFNSTVVRKILGVKELKSGKIQENIEERGRKRWTKFREFVAEELRKNAT